MDAYRRALRVYARARSSSRSAHSPINSLPPAPRPQELNAHRQTREETLRRAADIFGADNADLYSAFEGLLTRHMPMASMG